MGIRLGPEKPSLIVHAKLTSFVMVASDPLPCTSGPSGRVAVRQPLPNHRFQYLDRGGHGEISYRVSLVSNPDIQRYIGDLLLVQTNKDIPCRRLIRHLVPVGGAARRSVKPCSNQAGRMNPGRFVAIGFRRAANFEQLIVLTIKLSKLDRVRALLLENKCGERGRFEHKRFG